VATTAVTPTPVTSTPVPPTEATAVARPEEDEVLRYRGAMAITAAASSPPTRYAWSVAPRSRLVDAGLVLLTFVPAMGGPLVADRTIGGVDVAAAIVSIGLILSPVRRQPVPTLVVGLVAAVVATAIATQPTALLPTAVVLLFNVAVRTDRATSVVAGGAGVAVMLTCAVILASNGFIGPELLAGVAWPALAVAAGDAVRSRREAIDAAEERAARAEATRDEEARRRVAEERLHIARELHDVVAHHIAVINVQAGVAAHLLRASPDGAETALATVRSSAARCSTSSPASSACCAPTTTRRTRPPIPTPTIDDLPALVESFAAPGFASSRSRRAARSIRRATSQPSPRTAPCRRHSPTPTSTATARHVSRIEHRPDELEIVVTNPVGAQAAATSGYGLVGMRERIQAAGGTLSAGAATDGTFVVRACVPRTRHQEQP
jgi:signal transduction histidine kinase